MGGRGGNEGNPGGLCRFNGQPQEIFMPTRTPTDESPPARRKTAAPKPGSTPTGHMDAVDVLMADHREAEEVFEAFEKARSADRKKALADKVCLALKAHMQAEEEIFYPETREAGVEEDDLNEGIAEHDAAKMLIAEIEEMDPSDELYDAKVHVLSEAIEHHVKEEEEEGGIFAQARKNEDVDLNEMATRIKARIEELKAAH
jgi:hypothetical protein